MPNESTFKTELVRRLRAEGAHVTLIENMVGNGVPDLHIFHDGDDRWAEVKGPASLRKGKVLIRKSQFAWMRQRAQQWGSVMILWQDQHKNLFATWSSKHPFLAYDREHVYFDSSAINEFDNWDDYIHLGIGIRKL